MDPHRESIQDPRARVGRCNRRGTRGLRHAAEGELAILVQAAGCRLLVNLEPYQVR